MLKHRLYRTYTAGLKIAALILPMPRPTLFSGPGSMNELLESMTELGFKRVLLVTDEGLVQVGIVDKVLKAAAQLDLQLDVFSKVQPDPTYDQVESGLEAYHRFHCEGILALGGGSAMDCAKVIAAKVTNKRPIKKLAGLLKVWRMPAPLFAIPTTAGTGSEVTIAAVVSDPSSHIKTPLMDPKLVPLMAALDANLMIGLPPKITADTGVDALTHAIEAYVSRNATQETRAYSVAAIKLIFKHLPRVVAQGDDVEARHKMAMASYYAGLAFTKASLGYVHAFAHTFGAKYGIPHGMANGLALLPVLRFSLSEIEPQLRKLDALTAEGQSGEASAQHFLTHVESLFASIDIKQKSALIKREDADALVDLILKEAHWNYPVPKFMSREECTQLLLDISIV
ncbi:MULTISPECIES: iron-containing alcohol dehydrogenase [unclassified Vibrio]|uniref:iron-containing alcohol dehydrogenase n=1 Tax=unclassified Vibrio TaxID=2614977 RepID=UPI00292A2FB6|nr:MULTISPECIES: iron-containing alcohol dehydrogenase [unclassified Vibrio]MDU9595155.1 iron-containing alcohol dehydrogenase [Vibrio sp. 2-1-2a]MDU9604446.1 iron-containing alcohol dehydrogenase [Vibrio sp. 1-2-3a]